MKVFAADLFGKITNALQNLQGRNLYGILGNYEQLSNFEKQILPRVHESQASLPIEIIDINESILNHFMDEEIKELVSNESSFPDYVDRKITDALNSIISHSLLSHTGIFCKNLEILFSYSVDLSVFRIHATNQKIIFLIMPGQFIGGHITLFIDAPKKFQRTLPDQLLSANNIWELNQ